MPGPLIALGKLGQLGLLLRLYDQILIPHEMKRRPFPLLTLLIAASLLVQGTPLPAAARIESDPTEPTAPTAFSCDVVTDIPKAECEALVALYNSTNGANWANKSGWLVTKQSGSRGPSL
jgi:hypothetical protein